MSEIQNTLVMSIIKHQEAIIGPIAWSEARKVSGLNIDSAQKITTDGDGKKILELLVKQYQNLFGLASVEVCREATKPFLPTISKNELPEILQ